MTHSKNGVVESFRPSIVFLLSSCVIESGSGASESRPASDKNTKSTEQGFVCLTRGNICMGRVGDGWHHRRTFEYAWSWFTRLIEINDAFQKIWPYLSGKSGVASRATSSKTGMSKPSPHMSNLGNFDHSKITTYRTRYRNRVRHISDDTIIVRNSCVLLPRELLMKAGFFWKERIGIHRCCDGQ